ncbi:MAG TPA: hypothetical protein VMU95_35755 [Trebonia sp.]|nr:hypothetical protein [Trebonia sp.]
MAASGSSQETAPSPSARWPPSAPRTVLGGSHVADDDPGREAS